MTAATVERNRIHSVDLLRGLVMIIMALDHTRDFIHSDALTGDPLNLATTTPELFFTRWVTHFCAPVFVFLSGVSVYLQSARKSKRELSLFLIKRGLWFIIAEIVLVSLIFTFDLSYSTIALQVIWAIGVSMVLLGLLIWLPFGVILTLGVLIVFGHNLLDFYERKQTGGYSLGYDLIHRVFFRPLDKDHQVLGLYPFLAWTGLMLLGYCLGKPILNNSPERRRKLLTWIGLGTILLFILIRYTNIYGDPFPWSTQRSSLYSFLSFINCTKYPPSLLFICMTIGPALLFLAWVDGIRNSVTQVISVYGRVAFFYFLVHFLFIHVIATIIFFARGHTMDDVVTNVPLVPRFVIPGEGFSLGITYLFWAGVVILMYPVCKWYDRYKTNHKDKKWLSYL